MTGLARIVGRSVIGALWGALGAVWLLEPLLLGAQHLVPRTASHWLLVHALMTAIGAAFGAAAAVPIGACLTLWGHGRRRLAHDVEWHLALAIGPLLVPTWLLMSYVLQVVLVRSFAAPGWDVVGPAIGLTALFGAINGWVYRRVACRVPRPRVRMLAGLLIAGLGAGAVLHPLRFGMGALAVAYDDAPLVRVGAGRAAPLLVVGIDGANWRTLEPLLQQGRLPTLARLLRQGVQGEMHASWSPYWSSPAWAAMMTGYSREANGWYGDLAVVAPGLPPFDAPQERHVVLDPIHLLQWGLAMADVIRFVPPARDVLRRPLVWERLAQAGVDSGVLRFDFTYPATGQARFVVSNHIGTDTWALALSRPEAAADAATPDAVTAGLVQPFAAPFDPGEYATLLAGTPRRPPDLRLDPFPVLRVAYDCDRDTFDAAQQLVRTQPDLPVQFLYIGGFDAVCHHFWQYRFPDDYGATRPAAEDVAALAAVIDDYLVFVDRHLGALLDSYPRPPNVLLMSDHGHAATFQHPTFRAWHDPHGVFLAAGPDVRAGTDRLSVSYFEITPTVLDLLGFEKPVEMQGHSLLPFGTAD